MIGNRQYPSVHAVLHLLNPPTNSFRNEKVFEVGRIAHLQIHNYFNKGEGDNLDTLARITIEWLYENGLEYITSEEVWINKEENYAGRIDSLFRKGKALFLIDYKFLASYTLSINYYLQLPAYATCTHYIHPDENIPYSLEYIQNNITCLVLIVHKKELKIKPVYIPINPKLLKIFHSGVAIWHYRHQLLR